LLGEKERVRLFEHLQQYPTSGDVIPGSGGIRKSRWNGPGTGKRGGKQNNHAAAIMQQRRNSAAMQIE